MEAQIKNTLKKLEKYIKIKIKEKNLFFEALIHRSFLNEIKDKGFSVESNERLEFLGDACLELAVSEYLFKNFNYKEGELTSLRAMLVNRERLSEIGKRLELGKLIFMSKGQRKGDQKSINIIISNAFEAIIGAIFLQEGYNFTKKFIEKNVISPYIDKILSSKILKDPKTLFQEKSQEIYKITPTYKTLKSWGPDHNKKFKVGVFINKKLIAESIGASKQEAETKAAILALKKQKWI